MGRINSVEFRLARLLTINRNNIKDRCDVCSKVFRPAVDGFWLDKKNWLLLCMECKTQETQVKEAPKFLD